MAAASAPDVGQAVRIRILGPVDAVAPTGPVTVGGRLEKMLLAALAISANHAVSADALAQILWGDDPPPSRDNTLQTYVSRLRSSIGPERITSENHSYKLTAGRHDLDALEFESLVADATATREDPPQCLRVCKQALLLWRGDPFGDFADTDPFRLEVVRLDDLRLLVIELRLESEIALGREELVTGALEALVEEYPYRERLWHLYVVALALSQRRVEAVRTCNRLRAVLVEVGLEPTAAILRLEEQLLATDPTLLPRHALLADEVEPRHAP